jgi:hypothetical protein
MDRIPIPVVQPTAEPTVVVQEALVLLHTVPVAVAAPVIMAAAVAEAL